MVMPIPQLGAETPEECRRRAALEQQGWINRVALVSGGAAAGGLLFGRTGAIVGGALGVGMLSFFNGLSGATSGQQQPSVWTQLVPPRSACG
jgi:hypothetical protein